MQTADCAAQDWSMSKDPTKAVEAPFHNILLQIPLVLLHEAGCSPFLSEFLN